MKGESQSQPSRSRNRGLAFGAAGIGLAAALGAAWWFRAPLASGIVRWQLAAQGVDGDFQIERLDFAGADLSGVRLGPEAYPEAAALRTELRFAWRPFPVVGLDSVDRAASAGADQRKRR